MGADLDDAVFRDLDISVFEGLSQTSEADRRSLLRVQALVRAHRPGYRYVEIGSFLGGTLLPHLRDPACASLLSIDPRPQGAYPDARGDDFYESLNYGGVTTETMLQFLAQYASPDQLAKLATVDADIAQVPREGLGTCDLALVDGEHTDAAVRSDVAHLVPAMREDGLIAFHDVDLVRGGIDAGMRALEEAAIPHRLFLLPDAVGVLALRGGVDRAAAFERPA